jgi:hypothetical protein
VSEHRPCRLLFGASLGGPSALRFGALDLVGMKKNCCSIGVERDSYKKKQRIYLPQEFTVNPDHLSLSVKKD